MLYTLKVTEENIKKVKVLSKISPNLCKLSTWVIMELNLSESTRVISSLSSASQKNSSQFRKTKKEKPNSIEQLNLTYR